MVWKENPWEIPLALLSPISKYTQSTLYGTCWVRLLGLNVTSCHIKSHLPLVVIRLSWAHRLLTRFWKQNMMVKTMFKLLLVVFLKPIQQSMLSGNPQICQLALGPRFLDLPPAHPNRISSPLGCLWGYWCYTWPALVRHDQTLDLFASPGWDYPWHPLAEQPGGQGGPWRLML